MEATTFSHKLIAFFAGMSGLTAYASIFGVLLICGFGVPIPEDITLISAGILVSLDKISFTGAFIVSMVGVLVGDGTLFFLGRLYGKKVFTLPLIRKFATPERILLAERKVRENAKFICFVARFLPGLRSPVFMTAGTMGIKPSTFLLQDGFAAIISVPAWIYFGYIFGSNIDRLLEEAKKLQIWLAIGVVLLIVGYLVYKKIKKKRAA